MEFVRFAIGGLDSLDIKYWPWQHFHTSPSNKQNWGHSPKNQTGNGKREFIAEDSQHQKTINNYEYFACLCNTEEAPCWKCLHKGFAARWMVRHGFTAVPSAASSPSVATKNSRATAKDGANTQAATAATDIILLEFFCFPIFVLIWVSLEIAQIFRWQSSQSADSFRPREERDAKLREGDGHKFDRFGLP